MKLVELVQGSDEWLKFRNNKIGASDAPIIMGKSPHTTPYQLWQIKMGLLKVEDNDAMRKGRELEPVARRKFIDLTGWEVFPAVAVHEEIEYMSASFDGISPCGKIMLEIKVAGKQDHEMAMDGIVPPKYEDQLQQQLEVNKTAECVFYFSYKTDGSYKMLQIERDPKRIEEIKKEEKTFWDCMQNLESPDLIDRDYRQIDDEEWKQLAQEWKGICELEERKEQIRKRLIAISGQSNSMGAGIKLSKINRKGSIDYKLIPELKTVNLEKYRKGMIETYRIGIYK